MKFEHLDRIVFAGDSVTDMGSTNPVGEGMFDNLGHSYVRIIDNLLASVYPERFIRVTNSGISGNTSRDLLARWERDVLNLNPQWVSICIGINDVWRQFDCPAMPEYACTPEEYRQNLTAMLDSLRGRVKGVFLLTPYYMEPNPEDSMRKKMDEYGAVVKKVTAEAELPCIDLQKEFCDYLQYRHSSYLMWDRVHPGWIGSLIIARAFLREVGFDRPIL